MSSASTPAERRRSWATFEHRPSIDGVRAIAALLVILFHAGMPGMRNGFAGVDVFFVLSGFLITSLLVRELWSRRRLDLPQFYARRVRRLLPAALTVLVITAIVYEFVAPATDVYDNRMSFVFAAAYVSNWYFLGQSQDYFAADASPSPVLHYWSLSVEEQFYIVWPVIAIVLLMGLRRRPLWAAALLGGLTVAGGVLAGWIAGWSPMLSYFGTYNRAYQLLLGGTLAVLILWREQRADAGGPAARPRSWRIPATILSVIGLAALIAVSTSLAAGLTPFWVGVVSCIATIAILAGLEYGPMSFLAKGLASRVPRLLGKYSYSMYLWHWPLIVIGGLLVFGEAEPAKWSAPWYYTVPIVIAGTILLAAGTWWLIESRAMSIALSSLKRRRRMVLVGLAAVAVVAVATPYIMHVPQQTVAVIEASRKQTYTDVPLPTFSPHPTSAATATGVAASDKRIMLVGDSHALMLIKGFETLSAQQGWDFLPVARAACPWPDVRVTDPESGDPLNCQDLLRIPALEAAAAFKPDITILVSGSVVIRDLIINDRVVAPGEPGWLSELEAGSTSYIHEMLKYSKEVVVVDPIPRTADDMAACVANGGDQASCSLPPAVLAGESDITSMWKKITAQPGLAVVTLDELLCPSGICTATYVDANGLTLATRRDVQHLNEDYVVSIIDQIDAAFKDQGVDLAGGAITSGPGYVTPTPTSSPSTTASSSPTPAPSASASTVPATAQPSSTQKR